MYMDKYINLHNTKIIKSKLKETKKMNECFSFPDKEHQKHDSEWRAKTSEIRVVIAENRVKILETEQES